MARNGSGVYSLPAGNPVTTGTTISSTWANNTLSDIATALTASIAKDGQTSPTANLPMGSFVLTGLGAGTADGNSLRYEQLFSQGAPTDIASAATTDIGAVRTNFLTVTGTTGITSLGTNYNGPKMLRFTGALTLTHNATTLVLPGAANVTTVAGDTCIAIPKSTASGTPDGWNVIMYIRAAGYAAAGANGDITSLTALTAGGLPNASVLPADLAQPFTSGTSVATTSGSAINFTSVPSWVKRITVSLFGVSANGTDCPAIQIGTGGVVTSSGYKNETHYVGGTALASNSSFFFGVNGGAAANTYHGEVVLVKTTGNTWVMSGVVAVLDGNAGVCVSGGSVALAGALDIVSLMITGGNTFDAGSVNIHYE